MSERRPVDVAVVGGGLSGLAAAALVAQAGKSVALFEKAPEVGGRAATHERAGFAMNLGPHALYRGGAGMRVLRRLGVEVRGAAPRVSGWAIDRGVKHTLPGGTVSLLTTSLLGLAGKLETARLLSSLPRLDTAPLQGVEVVSGLPHLARRPEVQALLQALFRLSTYANAPQALSLGAALDQLKLALASGVLYLDHGWRTLVDGLRAAATGAGATIESGARVAGVGALEPLSLRLADGSLQPASAIILAVAPGEARDLIGGAGRPTPLARWAEESAPIHAACLDVALSSLPLPTATFALGIDRPLYLSVHSAAARLAPKGGALIHVALYLEPDSVETPREMERELEGLLDLIQPGWRGVVVHRRFLPHLAVSNALVDARRSGLAGRPGPEIPGIENVFVAGDWVGAEGMLADASLASAERAAALSVASAAAGASRVEAA
jgi:phytoene dehydrogenase-like protein